MDSTKTFAVPVDSEHKSMVLKIASFAQPHMRSFHLNWFGFFTTFVSTFGPAALIPVIREALNLNKGNLADAGIAAVTGTIGARVLMGSICDMIGPRLGMSGVILLTAAPAFGMALANSAIDFIMLRFGIGFGLSSFVCCQFWASQMFNVRIVGIANATAGGWGNLGGGVTQLLLPLVYAAIETGVRPFKAWRWAFYVPGAMHLISGCGVLLLGQDLPDGNYYQLKKSGAMKQDNGLKVFLTGIINYRTTILVILYAACFGVELTMNNVIVTYLFDQFGVSLTVAGVIGSCFGLMNLFARSLGGWGSDKCAARFGMRGRLWVLFITLAVEGMFCILMAVSKDSLAATIVMMICFSTFVQASEGASFAVVPFVSKRALGVVSGFVGAGGNVGSVFCQRLFFYDDDMSTPDGIMYMGIWVLATSSLCFLIYFPMWGGMLFPARQGVTEENYYLGEYTQEERAAGLADAAVKFAAESKSQRGIKEDLKGIEAADASVKEGTAAKPLQ